jgi:hypothetical protein
MDKIKAIAKKFEADNEAIKEIAPYYELVGDVCTNPGKYIDKIEAFKQKLASVTEELGEANRKLLCFEKLTPYRLEYGERIVNLEKELDQAKEVIDSTHSVLVEIFNHSMLTVRTKKIIQDVLDVMAKVKEKA